MARKFKRKARRRKKTVKQQVKATLNRMVEKKYFDVDLAQTEVTTAGVITNLGAIPQGDGATERTGDRVRVKNIHARFSLSAQDATNIVRVIWFRALNSQGTGPSVSNLLGNWYDPLNSINVPARFKIISDRTYSLVSNSDSEVRTLNMNLKVDKTLNFAEASTNPYGNALYFLAISDSSLSGPPISGTARLYFTDM